jgi:hypothetical protein
MKSPRTEASTLTTAQKLSPSYPLTHTIGAGPWTPSKLQTGLSFVFSSIHFPSLKPIYKPKKDKNPISQYRVTLCSKILNKYLFLTIVPFLSLFFFFAE